MNDLVSLDKKIQQAKACFDKINKSGRNTYQKHDYLETKDIFPTVREVCDKFGLKTKFDWDIQNNCMTLEIRDLETGDTDISTIPLAGFNTTDAGKGMQDIGKMQTYAMRYLYIQTFEIAVPDEIDNKNNKAVKNPRKAVKKQGVKTAGKESWKETLKVEKPVETGEVTAERIKEIIDKAHALFTANTDKAFTWENAERTIRKFCKNEKEFVACKNSCTFKTCT